MLWLLSFHLIFIITWFAGLFYLPRLFVYHSMSDDTVSQERFKIMERKLYYGIMTPGMLLTLFFGGWLLSKESFYIHSLWLQIKLFFVFTLIIYHFYCGYLLKKFKQNQNKHSHVFYRWLNEYPVVVLLVAVIMAVVKPF